METPRPYVQRRFRGGIILRRFEENADPTDLVWHQDRANRRIKVLGGADWKLQLESGLPFPLLPGRIYDIPGYTWHRLLRGGGPLTLIIRESPCRRRTISESFDRNAALRAARDGICYHIDNGVPFDDAVYRPGTPEFFFLFQEARRLYESGQYLASRKEVQLFESEIGEWAEMDGRMVPLDFPMWDEESQD